MTSHSNIIAGIFVSLAVHGFAFMHYQLDFDFAENPLSSETSSSSETMVRQMQVQLIKYVQPAIKPSKKIVSKPVATQSADVKPVIQKIVQHVAAVPLKSNQQMVQKKPPVTQELPQEKLPQEEGLLSSADQGISSALQDSQQTIADAMHHQYEMDLQKQRQAERDAYIRRLLAHIEAYKFYPSAARRRAIEGQLAVSFLLGENGDYNQLSIKGSRTVLQRAVRQALQAAQPFPKPPESMQINQRIAFNMKYQLE